ncbi:MAG: prepilin-type N-terminal cleavage/methylation domain-containing protein [Campylobacterota bacterium]|nr:prepilin-type N-terminal cleavage/methylation domain-containing protein [Campylobacterota bacterium]
MIKKQNSKKAFSLIEMGIVLIVIGIIIAASMTGGDIIKSADTKQFYQNFAGKWSVVINGYYDRMGKELADNHSDLANSDNTPNGYFDGVEPTQSDIEGAGINLAKSITTNQPEKTRYMVDGEFTGYKIVTIKLGSYKADGTINNYIILTNIPKDIAVSIDRYVDGASNGTNGNVIVLQKTVSDTDLPLNYVSGDTDISKYSYEDIGTITNIGILVEH